MKSTTEMINKAIHFNISPHCDIEFGSELDRDRVINAAISQFVDIAGRPNPNDYATLEINEISGTKRVAGILAKPRLYKPSKNGDEELVGWAVAVITPDEYDYICDLPEDEVDNALTSILNLEGDDARYWTKRY